VVGFAVGLFGGRVVGRTLGWSGTPFAVGSALDGAFVGMGEVEVVPPDPPQPLKPTTTRRPTRKGPGAVRMRP
jgi:hypothetical protein